MTGFPFPEPEAMPEVAALVPGAPACVPSRTRATSPAEAPNAFATHLQDFLRRQRNERQHVRTARRL